MSMQVIDIELLECLARSIEMLQLNDTAYFQSNFREVDPWMFVGQLHRVNVECWNKKYNETYAVEKIERSAGSKYLTAMDILNCMQYVRYQIEEEFVKVAWASKVADTLDRMIFSLMDHIIVKLPNYMSTRWGGLPGERSQDK